MKYAIGPITGTKTINNTHRKRGISSKGLFPMLLKDNSAKTNPITNRNTGNSATLDIPTELIVISLVLALLYIQTF